MALTWGWTTSRCTGRGPDQFYDPVAPAEFVDFGELGRRAGHRRADRRAGAAHRQDRHGTGDRVHRAGRSAARAGGCAVRHRRGRRGRGPGDRPGRLRLDRRRPGAVRRRARSRTATWSPSTASARCCGPRWPTGGWPSSSCAGWTSRLDGAARRAGRRAAVDLRAHGAGRAGRASTAAAPTAASPSTPTTESGAVGVRRGLQRP